MMMLCVSDDFESLMLDPELKTFGIDFFWAVEKSVVAEFHAGGRHLRKHLMPPAKLWITGAAERGFPGFPNPIPAGCGVFLAAAS